MKVFIEQLKAREVLDSRGFPTVEVEVVSSRGEITRAIVPSGASTGRFEALELRDGDKGRYHGKGVSKAIENIRHRLAPQVKGWDLSRSPLELDHWLLSLDTSGNKSELGANAILAVSLAVSRAAAVAQGMPWYRYLGGIRSYRLPVPLMNVLNGGAHANNGLDVQEFMIVPHGFSCYREALRAGSEVFHSLKKIIHDKGLSTAVGDEGGFAPRLASHEEALNLLCQAIEKSGYRLGEQVALALDVASSEFYQNGRYEFAGHSLSAAELTDLYQKWIKSYPIVSIEDGWSEEDWSGWQHGTRLLGPQVQLVGDDLFVTNPQRLQEGINQSCANALLVKMNQIGSISETIQAVRMAQDARYRTVMSHRSGESEDASIAHLAVGLGCEQIKTGGLCRSERMAKYNELLRIEEELETAQTAIYWGSQAFFKRA